jgi:hypothetical protein
MAATIKGIDVSMYQTNVDFAKVKAAGYSFVIIRSGRYNMTDLQKKMAEKLGLSTEDFQPKKATKVDELEAQVLYTALMTDTLIEEDKEDV